MENVKLGLTNTTIDNIMKSKNTRRLFILCIIILLSFSTQAQNIFRYNQTGGLTSLDPAFANTQANIRVISQIYNGLFRFSKLVDTQPEIGEKWETGNDGKSYTIYLRKGVYFQDNQCFSDGKGREVTAQDFVYTFKRILDPTTKSSGSWIFKDKVLKNKDGSISDTCFKAIDNHTLRIYLDKRFPAFLQILTMPYCYVVPKEAVEKYGTEFYKNPVGTGAFKLKIWQENQILLLDKNPNFWKKDNNGQALPYLDGIRVTFFDNADQAFAAFEKGELDFLTGISDKSKDIILDEEGELKTKFANTFKVFKESYLHTEYIGFYLEGDEKKNPFVNKKVRQALSYALDRKLLLKEVRNNLGLVGKYSIVPPAISSFDVNIDSNYFAYSYDLEKAKKLLKEAGYENFPTITLYSHLSDKAMVDFIKSQWEELGISVIVKLQQFSKIRKKIENGKINIFRASWIGDYPDAQNFLTLFYSKNFTPNGPNKTHFKNTDYDDLYENMYNSNDYFDHFRKYRQMEHTLVEECPIIPLFYDEIIQLQQKYVYGIEVNEMNQLFLDHVYFEK